MQNRVVICNIAFTIGNRDYQMNSLVSMVGISLVFSEESKPKLAEKLAGKAVTVKVNGTPLNAHFTHEVSGAANYYSLRFADLNSEQRNFLVQLLQSAGADLPAKRRFPRLEISQASEDLLVPTYFIMEVGDDHYFLGIVDFTIGGLKVEAIEQEAPSLKINSRVEGELFISDGTRIPQTRVEVVRSVKEKRQEQEETYTSFGLRIVSMPKEGMARYCEIIRDFCLAIKKDYEVFNREL